MEADDSWIVNWHIFLIIT